AAPTPAELRLSPLQGTLLNRGVRFVPPGGESSNVGRDGAYGFIHSLASAKVSEPVALDIRLEKDPKVGSRTWLLPEPGTEVFLGQAPSIRQAGESDSTLDRTRRREDQSSERDLSGAHRRGLVGTSMAWRA
ncbi:MAG: hypothetical protein GY953_29635, partial [bacterium]|nr:hypothetical protein [bacterium]